MSQDFQSTKSDKINHRRQNTKPYLPVIMTPRFEEIQDPDPERSSRLMR